MTQWNESWLRKREWSWSLQEIRRFLDTWYFFISISGHLYVRPHRPTITRRDVHAFLRRLDVLGNDHLPKTMTFDFRKILMSPGRWRQITETFRRYAAQATSATVVICDNEQSGGIMLILPLQ